MVKGLPAEWGLCSCTVVLGGDPLALAYWGDSVAVGLQPHDILLLNATTGKQIAVLSGHTDWVRSLAFSPDGILLVSGSDDKTLKLWDVQTGGAVRAFHGHTNWVYSISISANCTTIVSGSEDKTIRLWDIQTGGCFHVIQQQEAVNHVIFSPTNPQHLISTSGGVVWRWDINGHQVVPIPEGSHISSHGTHFISCGRNVATVWNPDSGAVVAKCLVPNNSHIACSHLSSDGRLVAVAATNTVYIWDITGKDPLLIRTIIGHTKNITSLIFSSPNTLISASQDQSVKFWQITNQVAGDPKSTPPTSFPIQSITLQAEYGIAISSDLAGVVRTWDISTGLCKGSFQTPATGKRDVQLINGRLVVIWYNWKIGAPGEVHVWDVEGKELLQIFGQSWSRVLDLRISGDASKVFLLDSQSIRAWSISTGEAVGEVRFEGRQPWGLIVSGSRVWLSCSDPMTHDFLGSDPIGWDFGVPSSPPVLLSNTFPDRPHFTFVNGTTQNHPGSSWIENATTGRLVFHLPQGFSTFSRVSQCDGQYIVVGYPSGDILILDFGHVE